MELWQGIQRQIAYIQAAFAKRKGSKLPFRIRHGRNPKQVGTRLDSPHPVILKSEPALTISRNRTDFFQAVLSTHPVQGHPGERPLVAWQRRPCNGIYNAPGERYHIRQAGMHRTGFPDDRANLNEISFPGFQREGDWFSTRTFHEFESCECGAIACLSKDADIRVGTAASIDGDGDRPGRYESVPDRPIGG